MGELRVAKVDLDREVGDVLLDQRAMAGVGNVYKSEVLFLEKVDPFAPVSAVDDEAIDRIIETIAGAASSQCEQTCGGELPTRWRNDRAIAIGSRQEKSWERGARKCETLQMNHAYPVG